MYFLRRCRPVRPLTPADEPAAGRGSARFTIPGGAIGGDLPPIEISFSQRYTDVLGALAPVLLRSIRATASAGRLLALLSTGRRLLEVELGAESGWLVEVDHAAGKVRLDAQVFATLLEGDVADGESIATAVLVAAWSRFARLVDRSRGSGCHLAQPASPDAMDLECLFSHAYPLLAETRSFLAREVDLGAITSGELRRCADAATIDALCDESEWKHVRAERALTRSAELNLLPALLVAHRRTTSAGARERISRVYRAIGRRAYKTHRPDAVDPISRSSASGRLAAIDGVICDLLAMTRAGLHWRGVDTAALAAATSSAPLIIDEGASDATTSLGLAIALAGDERLRPVPVLVVAADVANRFHLWRDSAFDVEGRLLQFKRSGLEWSKSWTSAVFDQSDLAGELEREFLALSPDERRACGHLWANPAAVAFAGEHPDRLRILTRDLFEPLPQPASLIRAFNVLYRRQHRSADAPSYFDAARILEGLRSIGRNLRPGGVAIVGSVVDHRDQPRWFTDYEIWQRTTDVGEPRLLLRKRHGRGLGVSAWRIEIGT